MSVHLVPDNRECGQFHASWEAWDMIANILTCGGGDATNMSYDGENPERIEREELEAWADVLENACRRVWRVEVKNDWRDFVYAYDHDGMSAFRWQRLGLESEPLRVNEADMERVTAFINFCRHSEGCLQA